MSEAQIKLLQQMPVFGGLLPQTLELILDQSETVFMENGEFFCREGERGESLYVLEIGSVVIEKDFDGEAIEIGQLGVGDCFGEMSLIDLQSRSASVRASSDCQTIEIHRRALLTLFQQNLEQYAIIMMNMGREVSRRLRQLHERIFLLNQKNELERLLDETEELTASVW